MKWPILYTTLSFALVSILSAYVEPKPRISDEFSNILMADTFYHGRLANPPHKHWKFFETMQVLQQPKYMSKYMPAQGFALFIGKFLFGKEIYGSILVFALAVGACYWCLFLWFGATVAHFCSLFLLFHPTIIQALVLTYWGNIFSILGGFLAYGGFKALTRKSFGLSSGFIGVGLSLCLLDRPFEGMMCSIPLFFFIFRTFRYPHLRKIVVKRLLLFSLPFIVISFSFLGYYSYSTLGSPMKLPHLEYRRQYSRAPLFVFQKALSPEKHRHPRMAKKFEKELQEVVRGQTSLFSLVRKVFRKIAFYLGRILDLPFWIFAFVIWVRYFTIRDKVFVASMIGGFVLCISFVRFSNFHYVSPAIPLIYLIVGRFASICFKTQKAAILFVCICVFPTIFLANRANTRHEIENRGYLNRHNLINSELSKLDGRHLVFVEYKHPKTGIEMVYNSANIDDQKIVWARYMSPSENKELISYYKTRNVWYTSYSKPYLKPTPGLQDKPSEINLPPD